MLWYPYAQMKTVSAPYEIVDADGVYLHTRDRRLIDSISSWWAVVHGYRHPALTSAIIDQAARFSHVMLGGLAHEPARELADKLASILPGDLDYVFFSDSGSVGVEVAIKMALQKRVNMGETNRDHILALENAYHGDTFKAMEVGDDEDYHFILNAYGRDPRILKIPTTLDALEEVFARSGERLACFIVEPRLQCAGGMRIHSIEFLQRARSLCDQYDVDLIFDEVATGFGRTGDLFVSNRVSPDIVVLGKALTGGYLGHAATVANRKVWEAFYDDDPQKALMHGPTFMGNPLACAAALASIKLFETEDYLTKIARIEAITRRELEGFSDPRIKEIRILGGCACIETRSPEDLVGYRDFAYRRGVFARPFGTCLYSMVPYVIGEEQLVQVISTMKEWFLADDGLRR